MSQKFPSLILPGVKILYSLQHLFAKLTNLFVILHIENP